MNLAETVEGILEETGFGEHLSSDRKSGITAVLRFCRDIPDFRDLPEPENTKSEDSTRIYGVFQKYSGIAMDLRTKAKSKGGLPYIHDDSAETLARVIMNDASLEVLLGYEDILYEHINRLHRQKLAKGNARFLYSTSLSFHGRDIIDLSCVVRDGNFKRFLLEGAKEDLEYIRKKDESSPNFTTRSGGRTIPDFSASVFCYVDLARAYYFLYELDQNLVLLDNAVANVKRAKAKAGQIGFKFKSYNNDLFAIIDYRARKENRAMAASG